MTNDLTMRCGWLLAAVLGLGATAAGGEPPADGTAREWPMLGRDAGWTNFSPDERVKPPFRLKWATFVDSSHRTTMSVAGGRLYGRDSCLDAETGDLLYEAPFGVGCPTFYQGRLYLDNRGVSAFDAATGKKLWNKPGYGLYPGAVGSVPVGDGAVYCGKFKEHGGKKFYFACALSTEDGHELWAAPLLPASGKVGKGYELGDSMGQPAAAAGRVFFTTRSPGGVFALDCGTGKELWRQEGILGQYGLGTDGKQVWATDEVQGMWALDAETGRKLWHWGGLNDNREQTHYAYVGTANKQPAAAWGMIFNSNYGRHYTALEAATGKELWVAGDKQCNPWVGSCAPAVAAGGCVYSSGLLGSEFNGKLYRFSLYAVDHKTGRCVWKHPVGSRSCGRASLAYGRIYLPGDAEYYCFEPVPPDYKAEPQPPPATPAAPPAERAKPFGGKPGAPEAGDKPKGGSDWPMYGGCPERCGLDVEVKLPLKEAWKFPTGGKVKSSPVIAGGTVYAGSNSGELFALELASGAKKWSAKIGCWVWCAPAVAEGIVVCGADDGVLRAFDAKTGEKKWEFKAAGQIRASPAIVGDPASPTGSAEASRVVFAGWDGRCYCVRLADGREFWRWEADDVRMRHSAPPAVANGRVYVSPWEGRRVHALDLGTGKPLAAFAVRDPYPKPQVGLVHGLAVYRGTLVPTAHQSDDPLLDAESGKVLGTTGLAGTPVFPCLPAFRGGEIYQPAAGSRGAGISAILANERPESRKGARGAFKAGARHVLVAGDLLIAATKAGTLEAWRLPKEGSGGAAQPAWEWKSPSGADLQTAPAAAGGFVVVGSDDGNLYAFRCGR